MGSMDNILLDIIISDPGNWSQANREYHPRYFQWPV